MEDARGQDRPGPGLHGGDHVLRAAGPAGGHDRDARHPGHRGDQLQVVAALGAVGVHAVQDELASPAPLPLHEPRQRVHPRVQAAPVQVHVPARAGLAALHVDAQDHALAPEALRALVDEVGGADGRGVHGDLVGAGAQHGAHVVRAPNPAADGVWDKDLLGGPPGQLGGRVAPFVGGGDVVEDDLVGALAVVEGRELDRVPGVPEVLELRPLHHAPGVHVEAGDHAHLQAHRHT